MNDSEFIITIIQEEKQENSNLRNRIYQESNR